MPFVTDEVAKPFEGQLVDAAAPKATVLDQLGAAIETDNGTYNAFTPNAPLPSQQPGVNRDLDYNVVDHLTDPEKGYMTRFTGVRSDADLETVRKRIDEQAKTRETLHDGPLPEWLASLTAGVIDPLNYLPAVGPLTRGVRGAAAVAGSVVIGAGAQETILSQKQYARTASESAANLITSAVFGGVIGGVFGHAGSSVARGLPLVPPKEIAIEGGTLIRHGGLLGPPSPVAELMSSTAVARFMDRSPNWHASGGEVPIPDEGLLAALVRENPNALNRVNNASSNLDRLAAQADALAPEKRIARLGELNGEYFNIQTQLSDLAKAEHPLNARLQSYYEAQTAFKRIGQEGGELAAQRRAQVASTIPDIARQPGDIADNLTAGIKNTEAAQLREKQVLEQRLEEVKAAKAGQSDAAEAVAQAKLTDATNEHLAAKKNLDNLVKGMRETLDKLSAKLGPTGHAAAKADVLHTRDQIAKLLEEGKDVPIKLQQPNVNDWLAGIARNPALTEAREAAPEAARVVPGTETTGPSDGIGSVGAAQVRLDPIGSQLAKSYGIARLMAKLKKVGLAAPSLELATSIFDTARRAVLRITDTGMVTNDNMLGHANPLNMRTEIKRMYEADMLSVNKLIDAAWKDHKTNAGAQRMSKRDFNEEVAKAMRRGDDSEVKEADALAKELRKFDDKYKKLMTEYKVGVFKEVENTRIVNEAINTRNALAMEKYEQDVAAGKNPEKPVLETVKEDKGPGVSKTAKSHFMRAYNEAAIKGRQSEWLSMLQDHFEKEGMSVDDAMDAARTVNRKILSLPESRLPGELTVAEGRGSAKERTFMIRDDFVSSAGTKFEDFLDNNPTNVMSRYMKTAAADVAYAKTLGGDDGVKDILQTLEDEAVEAAKAAKSPKDSARIMQQHEHEATLIQNLIERERGTTASPIDPRMDAFNRTLKTVRSLNVMRSLGGVIFSQLPDLGTVVLSEGLGRTIGTAITELVTGFKGSKLGKREAQAIGTAADMYLMGRGGAMTDIGNTYRNVSKAETLIDQAAHTAMVGFGIAPWTTGVKSITSFLGGDSILRGVIAIATDGKISDKLRAQLARDGIGRDEARLIYKEVDKFQKVNGLWTSGAQDWQSDEAKNLFANALVQRVDNAVITPGHGDAPLWTGTEIGKTLFQFKRFGWASNQRTLIAGAQTADIESMNALIVAVGMGILGTYGRDLALNGEVKDRSPAAWLREGVDRSGVVSQFMEGDAISDKVTGGHSPTRMLTGEQPTRFASSGLLERLGGPSVGMLADTSKALSGLSDGTISGQDVHNMTRLVPLNNFPPLHWMFQAMEEKAVNDFGLVPRQQR